jgi:hypothetical protein
MVDRPELAPNELFAQVEAEFRRVGVGLDTLIEVSHIVAGPRPPNVPPPPSDSFSGDLGAFQDVLDVLKSLPDNAGREPFISAMIGKWG